MNPLTDPILCRASVQLAPTVSGVMMYMPGGVQTITPFGGGVGEPIVVLADRAGAAALEQQRTALAAKGKRPYFDFDHADGPASFWVDGYEWRDTPEPGIYARGEWTPRAKAAVDGKEYRYFSPVFHVDKKRGTTAQNPARIVCRDTAKANMGGLVNDPAFHDIAPLWAKDSAGIPGAHSAGAAGQQQQTNQADNMNEQELAALRAKNQELQDELTALKAKQAEAASKQQNTDLIAESIKAKQAELEAGQAKAELEAIKAKNAALEAADTKRREQDADAALEAAVTRGAIAAKDDATKAHWRKLIIADPANAALLAKQGGNPDLSRRITAPIQARESVIITGADPRNVFDAYSALVAKNSSCTDRIEKGRIAREMAAIFAAEFRHDSRIMDSPIMAANSVGTLAGTLVAQRVLELLKLTFPALTRFTTDFSDQNASYNQTITSRIVGIPTVQTYNTSTGWTASDDTTTDVSVTINQHKGVPITFNANELASTVRNLFNEAAPAQSYALAKNMVDALYANITAANFTATKETASLADFGRANMVNMSVTQDIAGVPMGSANRTALLYSTYFGKLSQDSAIVTLAAFQKPEIITSGTLPDVAGYYTVSAPNLPAGSDYITGFCGSKSALVIATRLPNDYTQALPGSSYGNVTTVTDADLGISVMLVEYVDHKLGTATRRISLMYGTAVGQAAAGQLLTSQ